MRALAALALVLLAVAQPAAAAAPALRLAPRVVRAGAAVTITGSGWAPRAVVTLAAGPRRSEADPFASVRADARGSFRKTTRLSAAAVAGTYVFLACQRSCRLRATATLVITR